MQNGLENEAWRKTKENKGCYRVPLQYHVVSLDQFTT
jgi:hypothetical protein